MGYTLNIDHWDWVDPETQRVVRLRRGDKVPANVLSQEGMDEEELTKGFRPILLEGDGDDEKRAAGTSPATAAGAESQKANSPSPQKPEK